MMWAYGTGSGIGFWWMGIFWLVWVAIAAFVFGIIFWWTRKLVK